MQTDPVKQKIYELCPDVLELKFGCEVISDDDFKGVFVATDRVMWAGLIPKKEQDIKTVLGSPITLAVVLRAIKTTGRPIAINVYGHFEEEIGYESTDVSKCSWNLEHDNYDQQSEECKQFIGSLLNV